MPFRKHKWLIYRFYDKFWYLKTKHCVKFVQIRSFFLSVFSCIRIEYGNLLRKTKHCMKSAQIRTSKSSVFGHFSRSESQPIFPCSTMKFMFWYLEKIYLRNELADSADWKSTKYYQQTFCKKLNSVGHSLSHFSSSCDAKMLANIGPRGDLLTAPSAWM